MVQQYQNTIDVRELCRWINLSPSVFYYKQLSGNVGAKPSTHTTKQDATLVENTVVVNDIRNLLSQEFVCYGYEKVTAQLRTQNYIINKKKVYRLMNESNLLLGKVIKTSGKRQFVQHRKISANYPMEYLCLDIKYVWIQGESCWYYLLTIIDVYSRKVIEWTLQKSIKQIDVINMFRSINRTHNIKGVTIRNDNGSQFIANSVKQFLISAEAKQEFTHIATPEENSYIEAYHSILQREVIERFEFAGYYHAKITIKNYVEFYNNTRIHRSIGFIAPQQKWEQGLAFSPLRQQVAQDPEDLSRFFEEKISCHENGQEENFSSKTGPDLDKSGGTAYLRLSGENEKRGEGEILHNRFKKSVQEYGG